MAKKVLIILTLVLIILLLIFAFVPAPKKGKNVPPPPAPSSNIKLSNLAAGQIISSPLVILGEAKGWYFEGSFPVKIKDGAGNLVSVSHAEAKSDWMKNDFVPFEAEIEFSNPITEKGFVVLEKDNPSGLEENAESISIPIIFKRS